MDATLTGQPREAAQFAAETKVANDLYMNSNDYNPTLMQAYNERVVKTYFWPEALWKDLRTKWHTTGGTQWSAIGSEQIDSGYRVTLCEFDTPGLYSIVDSKPVHDQHFGKSLSAEWVTVSWTTEPSALESRSTPAPRPLVTSIVSAVGNQNPGTLCDKYAPEPFVQQPPDPIQPGQK
ncbi:hypothetical protein [Nocardia sp. alder85J]|uniref:hypothetical protein n=1 Tax=Nocardia sp. alder85J TaxID=2862949 RepID=UPI001CD69094|nr:hypothetical protein [Nocardia sp. alder85J]MCX4092583.1 hypothetical protein [Nocardia sp. alder85J]